MVGQMLSMVIAMMLLSVYVGQVEITTVAYPGLIAGMRTGFVIFSLLCIAGIFASLARNEKLNVKYKPLNTKKH
jgi:hypothetical protein